MTTLHAPTANGREVNRHALADLLDVDPDRLTDAALLRDELALDSLAMMSLLGWLQTRGVTVGAGADLPASVGGVLSLLDKTPAVSIVVTGLRPADGPASLPALPAADSPLAPVLSTPAFRLTPIEPEDVGFLYTLAVQPETCFRWRYRGAPPPFEQFATDLWTQVLVQYVARRTADGQPVGHVVAYGAGNGLNHAYVGAVFQPRYAGSGLAADAVALFVRSLFHTFPLRKIYLEIPGFNWDQVRSGEGRAFRVEGVLRDHHYHAGRYWNQYLCAIYPDGRT